MTVEQIIEAYKLGADPDFECRLCGETYEADGKTPTPLCDLCAHNAVAVLLQGRDADNVIAIPEQVVARMFVLLQGMVLAAQGRAPIGKVGDEAGELIGIWLAGAGHGFLPTPEQLHALLPAREQAPAIATPDRRIVLPGEDL